MPGVAGEASPMTDGDAIAGARRIVDLGNELEDRGDFDAALARCREAAAMAPGNARADLSMGNALQRQGNLDEAMRAQRSTLDALWMGIPLVALKGDRGIARGSFSIVETLGLPELTASTPEEFVQRNLALAADAHRRLELRRTLRGRMERSPLMDTAGFTRDLENAYREMWRMRAGK